MANDERGAGKAAAVQEQGLQTAQNMWQETLVELKKTTWPTREEANRLTYVVIGIVVVLSIYMGVLDFVLSQLDLFFKLT